VEDIDVFWKRSLPEIQEVIKQNFPIFNCSGGDFIENGDPFYRNMELGPPNLIFIPKG
jgi:hypothetical protein